MGGHCSTVGAWSLIQVPIQIPAPLFLRTRAGRQPAGDGSGSGPELPLRDTQWSSKLLPRPGQALAVEGTWGVNQWRCGSSLSPSLRLSNSLSPQSLLTSHLLTVPKNSRTSMNSRHFLQVELCIGCAPVSNLFH